MMETLLCTEDSSGPCLLPKLVGAQPAWGRVHGWVLVTKTREDVYMWKEVWPENRARGQHLLSRGRTPF